MSKFKTLKSQTTTSVVNFEKSMEKSRRPPWTSCDTRGATASTVQHCINIRCDAINARVVVWLELVKMNYFNFLSSGTKTKTGVKFHHSILICNITYYFFYIIKWQRNRKAYLVSTYFTNSYLFRWFISKTSFLSVKQNDSYKGPPWNPKNFNHFCLLTLFVVSTSELWVLLTDDWKRNKYLWNHLMNKF